MEQKVSRQLPGHYEPKSYWTQRVRPYVGIDDLGTVTATGSPVFVNRFIHWLEERALKDVLPHLPSGGLLLDVGCGYGRWFELYQGRGVRMVGIDIVHDLAKRGKALQPEGLFVVGDAQHLPFASETFDSAMTVKVLQIVPSHQQTRVLQELSRVTKQGGVLALLELSVGKRGGYIHPNSPKSWIALGQKAGLALVAWQGTHFVPVDRMLNRVRSGIGKVLKRSWSPAGRDAGARTDVPAPPPLEIKPLKDRYRPLARGYHVLKLLSTLISKVLEPFIEKILPRAWASHGVFVFRKE